MANTYGQLADGVKNYQGFEKEVASRLRQYVFIKLGPKDLKLCKKLYKKGYNISDTVGFIILNN